MTDERPEALLKSALEKIVYFEARSKQLENDVASVRAESERLKRELAQAGQREIELRRQVAGLEVELQRSHRERDELSRMGDALKLERTELLSQLIEASRIHASDSEEQDAPFDLASFIAQLRSEALAAGASEASIRKAAAAAAETSAVSVSVQAPSFVSAPAAVAVSAPVTVPAPAPVPAPAYAVALAGGGVAAQAERLLAEGRLRVSEADLAKLSGASAFPGRTEETLFGFSVRELMAPDSAARARAAERLRALGQAAAAPALATALHSEREPMVQAALLNAFAELASSEGAAIVLPLLDAPSPDVRISALKALLTIDATQAGPHLSAAMKDADRAVRRRASLLALGLSGEAALTLGEEAIRDQDVEVRSLGALVLGASGGERARTLLLGALRDSEKKVRKAAAQSLSRILGEDVSSVVDLDEAQRRRETRRLATLPPKPTSPAASFERKRAVARVESAPIRSPEKLESRREPKPQPQPSLPPREAASGEVLCTALANELRISIRGRTASELVAISNESQSAVEEACALLVARGQAVKRGTKFFAA